jgi:hypothetical protein
MVTEQEWVLAAGHSRAGASVPLGTDGTGQLGSVLAAAQRPPWQQTECVTPPSNCSISGSYGVRRLRRRQRYALRRSLWRVTSLRRVAACGRATRDGAVQIVRRQESDGHRAAATGLVACGSIHACPVCSAHIRAVRSTDIEEAARRHLAGGGGLLFLTLTLRHHRGEALAGLLDGLMKAWTAAIRGMPWKRKRDAYGIVGFIRSLELTWGEANGWHPHLHLLVFTAAPLSPDALADLDGWLTSRWREQVVRRGLSAPDGEHGLVLEAVTNAEGVTRYVAKVQDERALSLEMSRGDLKSGRGGRLMPFELLAAAGDGEAWAVPLWREYEAATKGRRCIGWSRGLRDQLGLGDELEDEDVVLEDTTEQDELVATIVARDWHAVCRQGLDAAVLDAAEEGGTEGVERVVRFALLADVHRKPRP